MDYSSARIANLSKTSSPLARPGLAQLVEHLTHRYSETTSSNPSNLTSATVCGDRTGSKPAAKRSACVAPEVDLGNVHYIRLRNSNKAEPTETQRRRYQKSKTGVPVAPKKDMCVRQKLKRQNKKKTSSPLSQTTTHKTIRFFRPRYN